MIHGNFRIIETVREVFVFPVLGGDDGGAVAPPPLKIDREHPTKIVVLPENTQAPAGGAVQRTTNAVAIIGFFLFDDAEKDVRLITAAESDVVGGVPRPLFRITKFDVIRLGAVKSDISRDSAEYSRLLWKLLDVKSFFYALEWNVTLNTQRRAKMSAAELAKPFFLTADERFFWNQHLVKPLTELPVEIAAKYVCPIVMGNASCKSVAVNGSQVRLALFSRRNKHRAGTRMNMRGIDSEGNVANAVETEQIVVAPSVTHKKPFICSYVVIRGSIPAFWTQLPNVKYKPPMLLAQPSEVNYAAAGTHFKNTLDVYGAPISCVNLVDNKGKELVIATEYKNCVANLDPAIRDSVHYIHFDYHKECKGGRTDRLSLLVDQVADDLDKIGYFLREHESDVEPAMLQSGSFRVNCVDNLDRTNVVQSLFARHVLDRQLRRLNIYATENDTIDKYPELLHVFKNIWADNADVISTQYSGTGALKTDVTRTGKRTYKGMLNDGTNSCVRYFKNNFTDGDMQDAYDFFTGRHVATLNSGVGNKSINMNLAIFVVGILFTLIGLYRAFAALCRADLKYFILFLLVSCVLVLALFNMVKSDGRRLVNNPRLPLQPLPNSIGVELKPYEDKNK